MGVLKVRSGGVWVPVAQGVGIASPGFVAESLLASDVAIPTGFVLTDILSVTFNAIAGHRYKITAKCQITKLGSGGDVFLQLTNSVNGVFTEGGSQLVVNAADLYSMHMTRATFSGSTTIKLRASVGGGTAKATSTQDGSQLLVEDITPAMEMGLAPSWTAPTLINGWLPFGSGWSVPGYRKVGDMVQLRGMVKSGTTGNIFTLPTGYASPNTMNFPAVSNDLFCQIRISGTGVTALNYNNAWVMLDGIQFSTTV